MKCLLVTHSCHAPQEESANVAQMEQRLQQLKLGFESTEQQSKKMAGQQALERQSYRQALHVLQVTLHCTCMLCRPRSVTTLELFAVAALPSSSRAHLCGCA